MAKIIDFIGAYLEKKEKYFCKWIAGYTITISIMKFQISSYMKHIWSYMTIYETHMGIYNIKYAWKYTIL